MEIDLKDTQVCDSCRTRRFITEFDQLQMTYDPMDPSPVVCNLCISGVVPRTQMLQLTDLQKQILHKYVGERKTPTQIAKELSCDAGYVSSLINGRQNKPAFRNAMRLILEEAGVDLYAYAQQMKKMLHAKNSKWNPDTKEWDEFDDNTAIGGTLERIAKAFALYEKDTEGIKRPPQVAIQVVTNIGSSEPIEAAPGTYVVEIEGQGESK